MKTTNLQDRIPEHSSDMVDMQSSLALCRANRLIRQMFGYNIILKNNEAFSIQILFGMFDKQRLKISAHCKG